MSIETHKRNISSRSYRNNSNTDLLQFYSLKHNYKSKEKEELLKVLRQVKSLMDGEEYHIDFDGLYEMVCSTLSKYDRT